MVRKKYFVLGRLGQPRQDKYLLYWYEEPNEPTKEKEGPLSFVLFEFPFSSVLTVSRGPSLVFLIWILYFLVISGPDPSKKVG
jgi:hypothetical protein